MAKTHLVGVVLVSQHCCSLALLVCEVPPRARKDSQAFLGIADDKALQFELKYDQTTRGNKPRKRSLVCDAYKIDLTIPEEMVCFRTAGSAGVA
jgi:hypothetical protein